MKVAVIGGGPAGLVTLKYLLEAHRHFSTSPIEATLFEAEDDVGGTFRYRSYEDAELVSSRQLTAFSDFRFDDGEPDFVTTKEYCQYLESYCEHFDLWPHIKLSSKVTKIGRSSKGDGHEIQYQHKDSDQPRYFLCDALAICSGLHVVPNIPRIPGIQFVPKAIHSSEFKQRNTFETSKDILILGAGETAMDIAYLAVTSPTNTVTLSHRNGWQNAPKILPEPVINGNVEQWKETQQNYGPMPPSDCAFASLFDTAYVHPVLEQSLLQWNYYTGLTNNASKLLTGTFWGFGQWIGEMDPSRRHGSKIIPNKSNKAIPYINVPYQPADRKLNSTLPYRKVAIPQCDTHNRHIELAPWPDHIDGNGRVHFQETDRPESARMKTIVCRPDLIVLATGYTQQFSFFSENQSYPTPEKADVRAIWKSTQPDVAFIGFVRPNFGAIPPLAELQAQLWITNLLNKLPKPIVIDDSWKLKLGPERRIQYAVDHESYAYRLALDLGSAPSIFQVASFGRLVLGTWALGPNFGTKFRLVGPWKWDGAAALMRTELWHVISRRRTWFVWIFFSFLPIFIFGTLSLVLYLVYLPRDLLSFMLRRLRVSGRKLA